MATKAPSADRRKADHRSSEEISAAADFYADGSLKPRRRLTDIPTHKAWMASLGEPKSKQAYPITFLGMDRRGAGVGGTLTDTPLAIFVKRKFDAGWRDLRVEADGRLVGGVDIIDGKRIWWAEGEPKSTVLSERPWRPE